MDDFSTPGKKNAYGVEPSESNMIVPGKRPQSSTAPSLFLDKNSSFGHWSVRWNENNNCHLFGKVATSYFSVVLSCYRSKVMYKKTTEPNRY